MAKSQSPKLVPVPTEISPKAAKALEAAALKEGVEPEVLAGRILEAFCRSTTVSLPTARVPKTRLKNFPKAS